MMARIPKTPRQRAEERLGVAERKFAKLTARRDTLTADLKTVQAEIEAEQKRLDYAKTDPDLPTPVAAAAKTPPPEPTP